MTFGLRPPKKSSIETVKKTHVITVPVFPEGTLTSPY